ncbi:MAG TPA: HK97-gp10 family putative phage morphogenesis protein [Edaphobacter sp.]|nr:HK97-gp10 family putative phage morphogenesis protein [Edaphobacter sp.]
MADGISITVTGLNELVANLDKLKTKAAEKVIRKSLRKGGKLMQSVLAEAAPVRPDLPSKTALPVGAMASDIELSVKKTSTGITATIGPGSWTAPYATMVEYGHRQVKGGYSKLIKEGKNAGKTRGPGKETGFVAARPWVRPTFESQADAISAVIVDSLNEEIVKAASNPDNISEVGEPCPPQEK